MAAPNPSRLDANQVLQGSYDESTGRLRTDSIATVVNADIDVALDATEDNVAIATPDGDFLAIDSDGSANARITNGPGIQAVNIQDGGNSITVDAVDLDIRNLIFTEDKVDVSGSEITALQGTSPWVTSTTNGALESTQLLNNEQLELLNTNVDSLLTTKATEATQLLNLAELQSLNTSVNNIESDTDDIRIAVQSIDNNIDVPLSTRATEATQLLNLTQLQDLNTKLEINNNIYERILPVLTNANFLKLGNFDSISQSYVGNTATFSYIEDNFEIAKATIVFNNPQDWSLALERYILDDDGSKLLDDNDIPLFLE